jgi:serine/threonine protein kinase
METASRAVAHHFSVETIVSGQFGRSRDVLSGRGGSEHREFSCTAIEPSNRMNSASSSQRLANTPAAEEGSGRASASLPPEMACDPDQATVISQRPPASGSGSPRPTGHNELVRQLAGERLNHFQLLEYVGGGGMGAVFRALDTMLNREVALKVLSRDQGADEETRRRFQNEAQSAARLDHENVARVYYVGEDRGLNYIVFEFIEGVNLRDLVEQKGPLPLPEALSYTLQMAHALEHAASRNVVHRDIKPSNVIITEGGRAKLVDMGLARLHQPRPGGGELTASGVTLGTFDYISPEQARDPRCADVRSDLYSLGCTVYYMLTGRPPFPDGTVLQKLLQHNSDAPPDPREFDPTLPPAVSALVSKMLAKDPLKRYQVPSNLVADLLVLADQIGCVLPGIGRPHWLPAPENGNASATLVRHLPWLVPVSLLFASVVAAGWPLPGLDSSDDKLVASLLEGRSRPQPLPRPASAASHGKQADDAPYVDESNADLPGAAKQNENHSQQHSGAAARTSEPASDGETENRESSVLSSDNHAPDNNTAIKVGDQGTGSIGHLSALPTDISAAKPDATDADEPIPEGLLVVADGARQPRRYNSLAEACAAARNNDVIELRYDGPRSEAPIALHNQRIEIRAGSQRRPLVVFRPNDTNPIATDRSMISIAGGSLKLTSVEIELDLTGAAPSENWSLFNVDQADGLRLEHCLLTIRNATAKGDTYHDKVSFFSVGGPAAAEPMVMMPKGMLPLPPVQMVLNNCLVRGEADLLVDRDFKPLNFSCINGLVAIGERLLLAGDGSSMPQEGARVRVELDHVTALVRQGLCRVAAGDATSALPEIEMRVSGSEIVSDKPDAALVEHISNATVGDLQARFHWEAAKTTYRGFRTFWKIATPNTSREIDARTYSEWIELWPAERETRAESLTWRLSSPRRRLDMVVPADFMSDVPRTSAEAGAIEPAGADFDRLPQPPLSDSAP